MVHPEVKRDLLLEAVAKLLPSTNLHVSLLGRAPLGQECSALWP